MTSRQALASGMTPRQLRTLVAAGWSRPHRGVYIAPEPGDPFRASVQAALLASPHGVTCRVTAARLHGLWGVPQWTAREEPELILPTGITHNPRTGMRLHNGLLADEAAVAGGFAATTVARTVRDLALVLPFDDLVCAVDCALRLGWVPGAGSGRGRRRLGQALAAADPRSESRLETITRLLLVRAGLAPEVLQLELLGGRVRVDMAWPSVKVAIEAGGREYHDGPAALYRDRSKANALTLQGWRLLRFTWFDVTRRPEWVVATVREAIAAR